MLFSAKTLEPVNEQLKRLVMRMSEKGMQGEVVFPVENRGMVNLTPDIFLKAGTILFFDTMNPTLQDSAGNAIDSKGAQPQILSAIYVKGLGMVKLTDCFLRGEEP